MNSNTSIIRENIDLFTSIHSGIMLHKRYHNFPIQLIAQLHKNLYEDLKWIKQQTINTSNTTHKQPDIGTTNELSDEIINEQTIIDFQSLKYIILINNCNFINNINKISDNSIINYYQNSVMFDSFEDEIYCQKSETSFIYKLSNNNNYYIISIIKYNNLLECINEIEAMCTM